MCFHVHSPSLESLDCFGLRLFPGNLQCSFSYQRKSHDRKTRCESVSPGLCSFSAHNGSALYINRDENITPSVSQQEQRTHRRLHLLGGLYIMVRTTPAGLSYCIGFFTAKFGHILHYGYNH